MKSQNQYLGIVTVIFILYNSSVNMKVIFNNLYFRYNTGYYFVCFCFARENSPKTNNSETRAGILLFLPCEYLVKADWPLLILQPMRLLAQYLNNMFSAEFLWNLLPPPPPPPQQIHLSGSAKGFMYGAPIKKILYMKKKKNQMFCVLSRNFVIPRKTFAFSHKTCWVQTNTPVYYTACIVHKTINVA